MSPDAYEAVIGLEVHTHLLTKSKLFCGCSTAFGAGPNENVCPVCMAMPGVLPVLNRHAVELAIRMGIAAHCEIAPYSVFDRKSYFYPDLPKGYQISQYELPLCKGGYIDLPPGEDGASRRIRLVRIHMEEDAGKNIHVEGASLVDFNRSGVPLVEIVSEPDLRTAEEAVAYLRELHSTLRYVEASDAKMAEGGLRCDVNISVRPKGATTYGTKTEIKNLNSFRFVEKAIDYEVKRQIEVIEGGGRIPQETHLWDPEKEVTRPMRSKEFANDYRYFPEPDLPPLRIPPDLIEAIRTSMPELASDKRARYVRDFELSEYEAHVLTEDRERTEYFESLVNKGIRPKLAANWIMTELLRIENESGKPFAKAVRPAQVTFEVLIAVEKQTISLNAAKIVNNAIHSDTSTTVARVIAEKNLAQVSDEAAIGSVIDKVLAAEADKVAEYRDGRDKLFGFFVGQVMKAMAGKGNPKLVNEILRAKLAG